MIKGIHTWCLSRQHMLVNNTPSVRNRFFPFELLANGTLLTPKHYRQLTDNPLGYPTSQSLKIKQYCQRYQLSVLEYKKLKLVFI